MTILERRQRLQERRRFFRTISSRSATTTSLSMKQKATTAQFLLQQQQRTPPPHQQLLQLKQQEQQQRNPTAARKLLWKLQRNYQKCRTRNNITYNNIRKLPIDPMSCAIMKLEVQSLLRWSNTTKTFNSNETLTTATAVAAAAVVTPLSMVNALLGSRQLFNVYAESSTETTTTSSLFQATNGTDDDDNTHAPLVRQFGGSSSGGVSTTRRTFRRGGGGTTADPTTQRRYDLINTLNQLQQQVVSSSSSIMQQPISSWEDAVRVLSNVFHFPSVDDNSNNNTIIYERSRDTSPTLLIVPESAGGTTEPNSSNGTPSKSSSINTDARIEMFIQRIRDINIEAMSPPGLLLRPSQHKWSEMIANCAALSKQKVDDDDDGSEQQQQKQEELVVPVTTIRALTSAEIQQVNDAMSHKHGDTDIVARTEDDTDSVQRLNLRTLLPREWVNDEVIHFYLYLLQRRDEQLCRTNPPKNNKRSHFFKSFFMTKLLNHGHYDPAMDGVYCYTNVKRWSKKVPGKDIFGLSKIIFPINQGNQHWTSAVIYMEEQRIQYYDSLGGNGEYYLQVLLQYLQDEHQDKKKTPLKSPELWTLVPCTDDTPRQQNGYDCGVFTCMFADILSSNDGSWQRGVKYSNDDMELYRQHIALSILNGEIVV